jgi:glyoxylase-like metal-dependent hydrolase (beta-lactamase superfamily II)
MEIAPGIRRVGTGVVNVYLLEEGGEVAIVDAGMPGDWSGLADELAAMGRSLADVRCVLLTHGHSDHIGFAERMRAERGVPVWIHEADAALARGEVPNPAKGLGPMKIMPLLSFLWLDVRRGGLRRPVVREVATFGDGATIDAPGSPRVVLTPGHTPGSAVLVSEARDAAFVGDAFCTYAVTTGERGPQVAPFTADAAGALGSLDRIEGLTVRWALPGHGEAWSGGLASAVAEVRRRAATR